MEHQDIEDEDALSSFSFDARYVVMAGDQSWVNISDPLYPMIMVPFSPWS